MKLFSNSLREQLELKIKHLDHKQAVFFSWLCSIRVLPFIGAIGNFRFWSESKFNKYLYKIINTIDNTAASYNNHNNHQIIYNEAYDANIATKTIFHAGLAGAPNDFQDATRYAFVISKASTVAVCTCIAADEYNINLIKVIEEDISYIKSNIYNKFNNDIFLYGKIWSNFHNALYFNGCGYWSDLYENIFKSRFQIDIEALKLRMNVPHEIEEHGAKFVADYLEQIESAGSENLNEARIILLGEMGAGKTSLVLKLQDVNTFLFQNQESTVGVDLSLWELEKNSHGEATNVHLWDFAGQAVTHSVHKFFLSERCVYIIVYDGRTEIRNRLDYWLNLVKTYGGDSPVFILVNKRTDYTPDINENGYKDNYPQIEGFVYLSLLNDTLAIKDFRN